MLRREPVERNQVFRRDLVGVFAERHVGDVQEPADAQVAGPLVQVVCELLDRLARACLLGVDGFGAIGKMQLDGPRQSMQLSISPLRSHAIPASAVHSARWRGNFNGCPDRQRTLETSGGLGMLPVVHQDQAKDLMKLPRPGDLLDRRATVDLKSVDLRLYSAMPLGPRMRIASRSSRSDVTSWIGPVKLTAMPKPPSSNRLGLISIGAVRGPFPARTPRTPVATPVNLPPNPDRPRPSGSDIQTSADRPRCDQNTKRSRERDPDRRFQGGGATWPF